MKSLANPRDTWIRLDNEIDIKTMWESLDELHGNIDEDEMSIHSADRRVDDEESDYM